MKKVLVLCGGLSKEAVISRSTGEEVFKALLGTEYEVERFLLDRKNIKELIDYLYANKTEIIVFNALHGNMGEDGRIQGLLDLLEIPYTHSGVKTSALAMDKILTKQIAKQLGITVAKDQVIKTKDFVKEKLNLKYPFVMKPKAEGSSVGLYLINNVKELEESLLKMQKFEEVMLEEYVKGIECTVSVFNSKAIGATEIEVEQQLFDYEAKYTKGKAKHYLPPRVDKKIIKKMYNDAEVLYKQINARGLARIDFIVSEGENYFLEINTQPGMTSNSLSPEQAQHGGISYKDFCLEIIKQANFDK